MVVVARRPLSVLCKGGGGLKLGQVVSGLSQLSMEGEENTEDMNSLLL